MLIDPDYGSDYKGRLFISFKFFETKKPKRGIEDIKGEEIVNFNNALKD